MSDVQAREITSGACADRSARALRSLGRGCGYKRKILEKMDLLGKVTPLQAKRKWDNLKKKYKDCKCPGTGEGVSGKSTAETWPWFLLMDEVLGQRPSNNPPVLIASLPEDKPWPSSAPAAPAARKRGSDELIELMREDMRFQRETEERRAQESRERMDRLFSLLERMLSRETLMVLLDWDVLHNRDPGKASCWWDIIWDGFQSV
ncbi:unnamed protein product [Leuciscus chuanchicus]